MKNSHVTINLLLIGLLGMTPDLSAEVFTCAFVQDKFRTGKSNRASCSMWPEKVYSTANYTPNKAEHCEVRSVYGFEDLEDVKVDIDRGTVSWVSVSGLTEYAKPHQKKYYIENGDSEEVATGKVNAAHRRANTFRILSHEITLGRVYIDDITQKVLDPPKLVPQHSLIFSNDTYLFHMYIPEAVSDAILFEPSFGLGSAWVGLRFGKCKLDR